MFVSFCTVTNNPAFIDDTYQSILKQNLSQWEWVIILDGIPEIEQLSGAENVYMLHRDDGDNDKNNIGAMKKKAFQRAQGDLLVDLDHDDILEPGAIQHMINVAGDGAAFLYGDSAGFRPNGAAVTLNSQLWKGYDRIINNYNLRFYAPPQPSPLTLSNYLTIPHQPRAWTKPAYEQIGGFDARCRVAAEHDLVCRTYAQGIPMIHVPDARSMYRVRGDSGNAATVKRIEFEAMAATNVWNNLRSMVAKWCRDNRLPTAVISCRKNDHINVASYQWHHVRNVVAPTFEEAMISLRGAKVGAIMFSDFLHVLPAGELTKHMQEMTIGMVDQGWILGDTPAASGRGIGDPLSRSVWNEYTFQMMAADINNSITSDVGLEIIYLNQYYPTVEHKTWNLPFVRSELCLRRKR